MVEMVGVSGNVIPSGGANPGMSELGDVSGGGIGSFFGNNPNLLGAGAGALAGAAGLLMGGQKLPYLDQLTGVANAAGGLGGNATTLFTQGQALINPLLTGDLPPGAEAKIADTVQKERTATQGTFARLGQTGSTMERDQLNDIDNRAAATRFDIAARMATLGVQETSQSINAMVSQLQIQGQIYEQLQKAQMKQDSDMMATIGKFAETAGKAVAAAAPYIATAAI
jgi:hypothetical protein